MNKFDILVRALPLQPCSLQLICSEEIPEQPVPPLHRRYLIFTPPPHSLLQAPNEPHELHRPTALKRYKNVISIIYAKNI